MRRLELGFVASALALAAAPAAQGKDQVLIISGGDNPGHNYPRYETVMRKAVEAFQTEPRQDADISVIEADGSLRLGNPALPPVAVSPATSKRAVKAQIQAIVSKLGPGDKLTLFVTDHGYLPDGSTNAFEGGLALYTATPKGAPPLLSHRELLDLLKDAPPDAQIRMMGIHCFSGGLQEVAMALPNACAATSTNHLSETTSYEDGNLYGMGFFEKGVIGRKRRGVPATFYGAHLDGYASDDLNGGKGRISSFHYAQKFLGEYTPDLEPSTAMNLFLSVADRFIAPDGSPSITPALGGAQVCDLSPRPDAVLDMEQRVNEIINLVSQADGAAQPDFEARTFYKQEQIRQYSQALRLAIGSVRDKLTRYRDEFVGLQRRWRELPVEQRTPEARAIWGARFQAARSRFQSDSEVHSTMLRALGYVQVLETARTLQRFNAKAGPREKQRLAQLIRCEGGLL